MPALAVAEQPEEPWEAAWRLASENSDAVLFASGVLGFLMPGVANPANLPQLEPWQVGALQDFSVAWRDRFIAEGRLTIRSGHGVGKTTFLCIIILFVLLTAGPDTKIPVVANSQDQLRDGLWPECSKWIGKLPETLRGMVKWEAEKIFIAVDPEQAFAVRRTASKHRPEALQGIHAKNILAIFEEASGIPEETIEAGAGTLSTPGAVAVAVGNPTRRSGFFYRTHTDPKLRAVWKPRVVSSAEVPRARGHIAEIIRLYGLDSNKYRVRVLGEFPTKDDDTVIPLELAEAAKGRKVTILPVWPIWGCDVARFGDDRITLLKRQGNVLLKPPLVWQNLDGGQVAGRIVAEYEKTPREFRPKAICVDVIGNGASVVDFLGRDGTLAADEVQIIAVNVAENPATDAMCHRQRDELWWKGREWFQARDCQLPQENLNAEELQLIEELIGELTVPTYDFTVAGKRIVMSKDEMKRDLGRSPDIADGFLLTFAASVFPRPIEDAHRRRHRDDDDGEGMAWAA